jgi:RNA polymerase sigma-70 factor (ECF subfamily)
MTDTELIEQFTSGNLNAFNRLVWRWEKPLYNFILRNIGNEDTAKDICQTAFIRMFKKLKKLRDPAKFTSWMYRIALNLCRDEFKKQKKHHFYSLSETFEDDNHLNSKKQMQIQDSKTPEKLYENQQIKEILSQALMILPEEQRIVIIMKHYQELKFIEIAAILEQPINTIKSRLYYGLRSLKKILEDSKLCKEVLLHEM